MGSLHDPEKEVQKAHAKTAAWVKDVFAMTDEEYERRYRDDVKFNRFIKTQVEILIREKERKQNG